MTRTVLLGGVGASLIGVVVYYLLTPPDFATQPTKISEGRQLTAGLTGHTESLQWMGRLPEASYAHSDQQRPFAEVIAILTATRRPEDAYKVYQILAGCDAFRVQFETEPTLLPLISLKKRCASITDVMRRSKNDYLVTAASAGVPGTAVAWLERGPSGDPQMLREKPDDPLVKEWEKQVSAMLIRDGDQGYIDALSRLMPGHGKSNPLFDVDPGEELAYATAYKMILDDLELDLPNLPSEQDLNALAANLPVEKVAWAKAKAAAIVSASRKRSPAS